ncbi:hypothetical protein FB45DRAFT_884455 [Roridomyces roridus]|uniref:Uncharacterized protein n=1 Tax=Roridomyces roridus TaxID=1738132 RepID=A0AAD7F7N5_9AGAR|nr:hypothetical protein FB45DRAFT_884455 [Roridomyces roridus]
MTIRLFISSASPTYNYACQWSRIHPFSPLRISPSCLEPEVEVKSIPKRPQGLRLKHDLAARAELHHPLQTEHLLLRRPHLSPSLGIVDVANLRSPRLNPLRLSEKTLVKLLPEITTSSPPLRLATNAAQMSASTNLNPRGNSSLLLRRQLPGEIPLPPIGIVDRRGQGLMPLRLGLILDLPAVDPAPPRIFGRSLRGRRKIHGNASSAGAPGKSPSTQTEIL